MKMVITNTLTGDETDTHSFERMTLRHENGMTLEIIEDDDGFRLRTLNQIHTLPVVSNVIILKEIKR